MTAARPDLMASERAGSLRGLASGIEKSLAAYGHVTLSNDDWEDVVSALRLGASQPDREELARIIDPEAWEIDPWNENWRVVVENRRTKAFEKADAILSLLSGAGTKSDGGSHT